MNRRLFLAGGLTLPILLQAQYGKDAKAKNIIYIYMSGGMAAQESWNAKQNIDPEYGGPFKAISTTTDDLFFSERFPLLAKETDKFSVIQSMTHGQAAHALGTEYMFTGYKPSPALKYPSVGSIVSHELGIRNFLPAYIAVPNAQNTFTGAGFLSSQYGPFSLGSDPASPNFKVRDLESGVSQRKRDLLEIVSSKFDKETDSDNVKTMQKFYDQAFDIMDSPPAQAAFDLTKESKATREAYGMGQAGQRLLMARRLVEAGTRIVKVNYGSWDNHDNIKGSFDRQGPEFDKALSYLFKDLKQKGLLNETIVIVTSEFGRTPKINKTNGRDHFPRVFSTLIGGGGIHNGIVYGKSDQLSMGVEENPVKPEDLFATVFHLIGIKGEKQLMTNDGRPVNISRGEIINELI